MNPGQRVFVQWDKKGFLPGVFQSYNSPEIGEDFRRVFVKMDNGYACQPPGFHPDCVKPDAYKKPRSLVCCCCGDATRGRQWWNRDTGYGLCVPCADRIGKKETAENMTENYGHKGIHYAIAA